MASTKRRTPVKNAEDAAKKEQLSLAKERIMKMKRNTLKIVEMMLEEDISKDWFLQNCGLLCQDDYQDVVQERSIEHVCGYPLCNKAIEKVLKQKYHISRAANKVYDLTERKCFCSNECYKASNFLKSQLPQIPLYMRKTEESVSINVLQKCDNSGSAGEEIVFHHTVSKDEIESIFTEPTVPPNNLSNILHEDLKGCEEHLSKLEISEKVFKKPYVFNGEANNKKKEDQNQESECSNSSEEDESDVDEERNMFPEYDNASMLSNKHMPIPDQTKKAVMISPLKATVSKSLPFNLSLDLFNKIFQDWFSEDTMKYLLGEKTLYSLKADLLFHTMMDDTESSERVASAKDEYVELCLKIDKLQRESLDEEFEVECTVPSECNGEDSKHADTFVIEPHSKPIPKRKPRKTKKPSAEKGKTVSFASDVKGVEKVPEVKLEPPSEECSTTETLPEPTFPLIDSLSQNSLRRQVLTTKLKTVYNNILPFIDLQYKDIRDGVNKIIETFSLTPKNVTFKPKEFKVIAILLFRILSKTTLKEFEDSNFSKLCKDSISDLNISSDDIENLASNLISKEQIRRLASS